MHPIPETKGRGFPELIYRYTVSGSAKAGIDTGSDAAQAGSNDWANGDLLEILILARTDQAITRSSLLMQLNGDTSSIYDQEQLRGLDTSVASAGAVAAAQWSLEVPGSSAAANYAAFLRGSLFAYTSPTFYKTAEFRGGYNHTSAASNFWSAWACSYRSTSAVTRIKIFGGSSSNFAVGSQLLVYKRLA